MKAVRIRELRGAHPRIPIGRIVWDGSAFHVQGLSRVGNFLELPMMGRERVIRTKADGEKFLDAMVDQFVTSTVIAVEWDEAKAFGGEGSGHHGHAGRPGQVGGSLPGEGGGSVKEELRSDLPPELVYNSGYKILLATRSGGPSKAILERPSYAGLPKPQAEKVWEHEDATKRLTYERAALIGENGEMVFEKAGSDREVRFTDVEIENMRDKVLTHNHPSGSVLSIDDLRLASRANMAEIRAVAKDGSVFRMTRLGPIWPDTDDLLRHYNEILGDINNRILRDNNAIGRGVKLNDRDQTKLGIEHLTRLAEKYQRHRIRFHGEFEGKPLPVAAGWK